MIGSAEGSEAQTPIREGMWRPRGTLRLLLGLVIATGAPFLALLLVKRGVLSHFPSMLFLACIVAAALCGRVVAGLVAVAVSAALLGEYVIEAEATLLQTLRHNTIDFAAFAGLSVLVVTVLARTDRALALEQRARRAAGIAQERLSLISEISAILATSFELTANLEAACAAIVRRGAWDKAQVFTHDGHTIRYLAPVTPAGRRHGRRGNGITLDAVAADFEAGRVHLLDRATLGRRVGKLGPARYKSGLVVPLLNATGSFGGLVLLDTRKARSYSSFDLVFAQELGERIARAFDNVRRYEHQVYIAHTLQQSLLPKSLPSIPGLAVHARYQAGAGTEVGGDFYDVFGLDQTTWMVVIGDVCGKGPEAAAVMTITRATLRALALHEQSPAKLLSLLNEALLTQVPDLRFVTVCCATLRMAAKRMRLTLALAGHPPPMLRRHGGTVEPVSAPYGPLLGVFPTVSYTETVVEVTEKEAVVFYTDGIETRELTAQERALSLLEEHGNAPAAQIAERFAQIVRAAPAGPKDDLVVLTFEVSSRS